MTVKLVHNAAPPSGSNSMISVAESTSAQYPLTLRFTSNKHVKTYNSDGSVACDLAVVGVNSCNIVYRIEVLGGANQTAAI